MTLEISVQIWTPGGHKKKSEKENKTGLTLLGDTIESITGQGWVCTICRVEMAIKGGFDASGRVLARGSAPINYFIIGTVGYGIYNKLFYFTGTVGFGVGIGVHMSPNKLFHHGYCCVWYVQ